MRDLIGRSFRGLQGDITGEAFGDHDVDRSLADVVPLHKTRIINMRQIRFAQHGAGITNGFQPFHLLDTDIEEADRRLQQPQDGAREDVAILCERIVVGQRDEIFTMQTWLRDRDQPVPDAASTRHKMKMNGVEHEMLMAGMLTDEEMAELDRSRGPEFDRLFLNGMIRHHQGAIDMVDVLFKAYGAAQDELVFKFASDVYADQSIEIDRMTKMLDGGSRLE